MRGTSLKLSCLVFYLVAFTSFLSAEARHKPKHDKNCHKHPVKPCPVPPTQAAPIAAPTPTPAPAPARPYYVGPSECGSPCFDDNDCDYPCYLCIYHSYRNKTCGDDIPFITPPSPAPTPIIDTPTPQLPPSLAPTPPPAPAPARPYYEGPSECGSPCFDDNDCNYPCYLCIYHSYRNRTCGDDIPFMTPPSPAPAPIIDTPTPQLPPSPALVPIQTPPSLAPTPYQINPPYIHGDCGSPCRDSNDCNWPCTLCCWQNQTCCYEESFFELPPPSSPSPPPIIATPTPTLTPNNDGMGLPPYQPRAHGGGCGDPCSDSNDCDGPCTWCCGNNTNNTCCYEELPFDTIIFPPSPSSPPLTPPSPSPFNDDEEEEEENEDFDLSPQPSYYAPEPQPSYDEYVPYSERGCGYGPCKDSNDCGWPCTECCSNHTCCHRPTAWAPTPMSG